MTTPGSNYKCSVTQLYSLDACGVKVSVCDKVYEPSDDTWLLLDTLTRSEWSCRLAVDVGTGTGIVAACLALRSRYVVAIDIDECAVACAHVTLRNVVNVDVVQCDNLTCLRLDAPDLIAYNTPYLPVEGEHIAWSGGPREAIRTLWYARASRATIYLVFSTLTPSSSVFREAERLGYTWRVAGRRPGTFFEEILAVVFKPHCYFKTRT